MKILAVFLVIVAFGRVSAQEYAFKVLISKGQNEIRTGNEWFPVKVGASLKSADELRISQNGYLGLVHITGKPLEIKNAGQHKVADLAARMKGGSSVLNKYTEFILSSSVVKSNNLTATGAVKRGTDRIKVLLPNPQLAIVFNDVISISWTNDPNTSTYVVGFHSMFGDELHKIEVADTTISVDLNNAKFSNEDNIVVRVTSKNDSNIVSEDFVLKKLSAADKKRIKALLIEVEGQTKDETALNQLYLAAFYEQNALLIDAGTAHRKAMQLAPNVPHYTEAYNQYLLRNGLNE